MNIFLAFCGIDQEGLGNGGGEGGEEEDGEEGGFEEHVGWCLGSDGCNCFLLLLAEESSIKTSPVHVVGY